jgi:apolipoprotein N-acyltransferase
VGPVPFIDLGREDLSASKLQAVQAALQLPLYRIWAWYVSLGLVGLLHLAWDFRWSRGIHRFCVGRLADLDNENAEPR